MTTYVEREYTNSELSERDRAVVELVGRFRQLTTKQVRALNFANLASPTPADRTLKRLVERKYLARLERLLGGHRGGSAQYVYQLGRAGWKLLYRPGAYWAPRAVNLHALAVADCFVALKEAEQRAELEVISFITEPDCHQIVSQVRLTPDAYVELTAHGQKLTSWLEVDRGTEHLGVIQEKCERYWQAFRSGQWDGVFPYVLFIVPDERRKRAVHQVFQAGPAEAAELFSVCSVSEFPKFN
ncbi:replication-relaxation family protein [Saccharothrix texasensis]|uniref:Protein involved in plasmid replication-relaxation n=1 Tax=Saccharothrix texasensis TaxID=103734 RepID=A0A3N1H8Z0_9PSEU|nr:replication-relaxation family protein [Saccharothrix texasensis]ROP38983.1 protein involved in plasmid replication-relaxation [Saccharothrix texasensis]